MGMSVETKAFFDWSGDSGSVLMEFIIVLPIYTLLLGFAFVVGELSLETIHLAGSADRICAFAPAGTSKEAVYEPFTKYKVAASPNKAEEEWDSDEESDFSYRGDPDAGGGRAKVSDYNINPKDDSYPRTYVADAVINGPWVEMSAAKVEDNYTLPTWTRGLVAYWYRKKYNMTGESIDDTDAKAVPEIFKEGKLGRSKVMGKTLDPPSVGGGNKREFGYYTLRRHGLGDERLTYRTWGNGRLASGDELWKKVASERFPDENDASSYNASSYKGIDGTEDTGKLPLEWQGVDVDTYVRKGYFMEWSD